MGLYSTVSGVNPRGALIGEKDLRKDVGPNDLRGNNLPIPHKILSPETGKCLNESGKIGGFIF